MKGEQHRYCAGGEQCSQYPHLGEPSKLRISSESSICEACRQAEASNVTAAGETESATYRTSANAYTDKQGTRRAYRREENILRSSAEAEIRNVKNELVISLFTQKGAFWELVKESRELWDITPKVQVPPESAGPRDPISSLPPNPPWIPESFPEPYEETEEDSALLLLWWEYVRSIQQQMVPEKYREKGAPQDWSRFLAVCILYDPPHTQLTEFAGFGDPEPTSLYDTWMPDNWPHDEFPRMLAPPIRTLRELREPEYWRCVAFVLIRQHISSGHSLEDLFEYCEQNAPELVEEYRRKAEQEEAQYYIEVDEHTTTEDIENASRMIRSVLGDVSGGAPSRDKLVALQCALLYDRHNSPDATDTRRREWTHKRLSEYFNLNSARAAKNYIAIGREILEDSGEQ